MEFRTIRLGLAEKTWEEIERDAKASFVRVPVVIAQRVSGCQSSGPLTTAPATIIQDSQPFVSEFGTGAKNQVEENRIIDAALLAAQNWVDLQKVKFEKGEDSLCLGCSEHNATGRTLYCYECKLVEPPACRVCEMLKAGPNGLCFSCAKYVKG